MKTTLRKCSTQFPIRLRALDVAVFGKCWSDIADEIQAACF